jgi:hypothetical protein
VYSHEQYVRGCNGAGRSLHGPATQGEKPVDVTIERALSIAADPDGAGFREYLDQAIAARSPEALVGLVKLYLAGRGSFFDEQPLIVALGTAMLFWGPDGIDALTDAVLADTELAKTRSIGLQILSSVAAGVMDRYTAAMSYVFEYLPDTAAIIAEIDQERVAARAGLRRIALAMNPDDLSRYTATALMTFGMFDLDAATVELQTASAFRWMAVGPRTIGEYEALIASSDKDEPALHTFLEENPQLLDPMAVQVWSKPDFHGKERPDFLVRRADDSYLVVEIETPTKPIVLKAGGISGETRFAIDQASGYRRFLQNNIDRARLTFPGIEVRAIDALVVIGREDVLDSDQAASLANANADFHRLAIVGFDWIARRAHAVSENIIRSSSAIRGARL